MTGKILDNEGESALILILPLIVTLVFLFLAWPLVLAIIILLVAGKIWQQYQWKQWSKQVNPFFNQLLKENRGCVTPVDLSLKANLTGAAAQRFLEKKAEEYGAQRKVYEDRGTVYYFLTASALGEIFADSDPPVEDISSPSAQLPVAKEEPLPPPPQFLASSQVKELVQQEMANAGTGPDFYQPTTQEEEITEKIEAKAEPESHQQTNTETENLALIQADLAKRLEVHPSTIGKRKLEEDFAAWSQSKDPKGIAWYYDPQEKLFLPCQ